MLLCKLLSESGQVEASKIHKKGLPQTTTDIALFGCLVWASILWIHFVIAVDPNHIARSRKETCSADLGIGGSAENGTG